MLFQIIKKSLFFINIMCLFLLFFSNIGYAQIEVTLSPLKLEFNLNPGSKKDFAISVINEMDKEIILQPNPIDVYQKESNGQFLPNIDNTMKIINSCTQWIRMETTKIVIPPKKRYSFGGTIVVPRGIAPGTYSTIVLFKPELEETTNKNEDTTKTSGEFSVDVYWGTVILLQVNPRGVRDVKRNKFVEIEKFEVNQVNDGISFSAKLVNMGKNYVTAEGKIAILQEGQEVNFKPFGRGTILPGQKLNFKSTFTPPFIPGDYKAIASFNYGGIRDATVTATFKLSKDQLISSIAEEIKITETIEDFINLIPSDDTIEAKIFPGNTRTFNVQIINGSSKDIVLKSWSENVSDIISTKFSENVNISPENAEIKPSGRNNFKITVISPKNIEDGNKYIRINFTPIKFGEKTLEDEKQKMSSTTVFLILENVKGNKIEKIKIKNMDIQVIEKEKGFYFPRYIFTYENQGNVHIDPVVYLNLLELPLEDKNQEKTAELITDNIESTNLVSSESSGIILPGMEGQIYVDSTQPIEKGNIKKYFMKLFFKNNDKEIYNDDVTFTIKF
ncbi:hypothetical protein [Atribacter laminatus]|uniref:Uncharacterized protein n=1 Tax=Atribacter laminatus TaxID=2847778 RepID=A0A7T1AP11_ATRLM|nr:hypothetical protein [Atribacter laminatus]QPM69448.1 hypothetical protein RT761_02681 [Atribacter laminatus]